jgi:hypothetical protein
MSSRQLRGKFEFTKVCCGSVGQVECSRVPFQQLEAKEHETPRLELPSDSRSEVRFVRLLCKASSPVNAVSLPTTQATDPGPGEQRGRVCEGHGVLHLNQKLEGEGVVRW